MAFKLPSFTRPAPTPAAAALSRAAGVTEKPALRLPLIGSRPVGLQLQILGTAFLLFLSLAAFITAMNIRGAGYNASYLAAAGQMRTLAHQTAKATLSTFANQPGSFAELRDSATRMSTLLERLAQGGDIDGTVVPPSPEAVRPVLETLRGEWARQDKNLKQFLAQEKTLTAALADPATGGEAIAQVREIGLRILKDNRTLAPAADALAHAYAEEIGRGGNIAAAAVLGSLALAMLVLMVKVFNDDASARRIEAERQQRLAEDAKNATQEAILRLMNELGDLADGDLTVRATVGEDITGAIADSVNYTVEELSVLVKRINDTASRVTRATSAARETSGELLAASEQQSGEIRAAGDDVRAMAQSMTTVSTRATESAQVARQSLDVAEKGAMAVQDAIAGMNDIRGQIQETSKRIKRLGESSQEIGEIVELISDITEQTNVLALNAAIQAASAGEAGRGFSVVAEEVQRLAERSGEATKQIAAIVKTIQADTHDAVAAMENSTRGVVEGAKRSDAAGQALAEISAVSRRLAQLIEGISTDTQQQSGIATRVARAMEEIQRITAQTTDGTQQTAVSIGELADLAGELKGSVAGFKV